MNLKEFGQTIKSKHPEYNDMGDEDLANKMLAKFPEYKDMISAPDPKGIFSQIGDRVKKVVDETKQNVNDIGTRYDIAKASGDALALPKMALSATAAAPKAVGSLLAEGAKQVIPKEIKNDAKSFINTVVTNPEVQSKIIQPLSAQAQAHPDIAQGVKDVVDIASVLPGPKVAGEAAKLAETAGKTALKTGENVAKAGVESLARTPEQIAAATAKNQARIDKLSNVITRGDSIQNTKTAAKILSNLDVSDIKGIKVFKDIPVVLQNNTDAVLKNAGDVLLPETTKRTLPNLKMSTKVGDETVKYNYVNRALNGLKELYTKTAQVEDKARIGQLIATGKKEGFTLSDVDKIAKEYGTQVGSKAFSATTGDLLKGLNAHMFENIRSGLKDTIKSFLPKEKALAFDSYNKAASKMIETKKMFEKLAEEVNTKVSKVREENVIKGTVGKITQPIVGGIVDVTETLTGGSIGKLFSKFIKTAGEKELSILDVQKDLRKMLIQVKKLSTKDGTNIFNKLSEMMK